MYRYVHTGELQHHGVKGMKWGVRRSTAQLGRTMITKKRQITADKSDLKKLNSGGRLSVGFTKKRQDAYNKRDKTVLERRIKDNEKKISSNKTEKINKKIGKLENLKKSNKMMFDTSNKVSEQMQGKGSKKSEKTSAYNKAVYKKTEVKNNYQIAKQQAKKDPSYKESTEYKNAKKANSKERTHEMIHGSYGSLRINTLKERGYSNKSAVARTYVETVGTSAVIGGLLVAMKSS